jgi:hypothetical protein
MPRHKQETTCCRTGGPTSKSCSCAHCQLDVCSVCGGGEIALTTDCPGTKISGDRLEELCETDLDYTEARGWHLSEKRRSPRFEHTGMPPEMPQADPRTLIAPSITWAAVDRNTSLQSELTKKAIAWVLAARTGEECLTALDHIKDEIGKCLANGDAPADLKSELLTRHEHAKEAFHLADQHEQRCDDEFKQVARLIVAELEGSP